MHHRTTLSGYILATTVHIDNRKKNLLSINIASRCPQNMVNFGPLAAEIGQVVWGTPANFNGFRVQVAVLLHGTVVVGVTQTAALNRRRHLYSAGRPSCWALAHILVCIRLIIMTNTENFELYRVSKTPLLACYNFDTHEWILIFLVEILPIK